MKKFLMALGVAAFFGMQPAPAEAHQPVCPEWTMEYRVWNGHAIIIICRDMRTSQPIYYAPRYRNHTRNYYRDRSHTHRSRPYGRHHRNRHHHRHHRR